VGQAFTVCILPVGAEGVVLAGEAGGDREAGGDAASTMCGPRVSEFPCTRCGACCAFAGNDPHIQEAGWALPDGSCANYDRDKKACRIYEDRPWFCRAAVRFGKEGHEGPLAYCDKVHMELYGAAREREGDCEHEAKEK
jgi:Fe-S-cluster containining protein